MQNLKQIGESNGVPKLWNRVKKWQFLAPAIYLKRSKQIEPRLLLITNRKSHTRFRLVPKPTTLNDLERPLRTLLHNKVFLGAKHEDLKDDRPVLLAAVM